MNQRQRNLLWLKDMLGHLQEFRDRLEWAEDAQTVRQLTESMLRDLNTCRQLCEQLQGKPRTSGGVHAA